MASEASWQTSAAAKKDGSFAEDQRTGDGTRWNKPLYEPLDQYMIEGLLQRLVDRFEESERLYGKAIEELNSRLDRLSQNRDVAEPAAKDTFDSLHAQVRDLAQRFEPKSSAPIKSSTPIESPAPREAPTPLENFERLGKDLAGGLHSNFDDSHTAPTQAAPEPSPFAKSIKAFETPHIAPALDLEEEYEPPAFTPAYTAQTPSPPAGPHFDKQLVEMAAKLEQSIDTAMPTGAIDALNARLDAIGQRIAEAVDGAPNRSALEHVESHIAGMGRQLAHAEAQLNKIESVDDHLRKLIVRLDEKDLSQDPARIVTQQAQDIAAKAAGNAARLVADDTQKTTERLDAMQRELAEIGQTSRISSDKVISTLEAVNDQLNRLARQVDSGAVSGPKSDLPLATGDQTKSPLEPARPSTSSPASISEDPKPFVEEKGSQTKAATAAERPRPMTPILRGTKPDDTAPEKTSDDALLNAAPDDLVAAARQAAQAAAARAEERAEERSRRSSGRPAHNAQTASRWRPLLIITAAGLLVFSAVLLYGRLDTKTEPVQSPAAGTPAAPSATTPKLPGQTGNTAVPKSPPAKKPSPAKNRLQPAPDAPADGAAGQTNRIEVGQTLDRSADRLASGIALPAGVSLSTGGLSERISAP